LLHILPCGGSQRGLLDGAPEKRIFFTGSRDLNPGRLLTGAPGLSLAGVTSTG
jgi:hypothetical protein